MPIYEYRCQAGCPNFDVIRSMGERRDPVPCEMCGTPTDELVINPSSLYVKSNGYYSEALKGYVGCEADKKVLMKEQGVEELDCSMQSFLTEQRDLRWRAEAKPKKMPEEFAEAWKKTQAEHPTTPENAL
jgi:putative FmdB family regulatory protein